jgi:formate dehydrogenase
MIKKFTHCGICLAACGMEVDVEDNRIISLRGDPLHPLTRGFLCAKGRASIEMADDKLRLLHPYERTGAERHRITWDEANKKISSKLRKIISKWGPNSVATYYGAGTPTSSMNYMMADGFLRALGSDRMYNVLTLEFTNRYLVMEKMYGKQFFVTQPDIENTQCLLIFGSNPLVSIDHPGIIASIKALKKRGGKLIVVDPRKTETAQMADLHVPINPGTDLLMLQGMVGYIFKNKLCDFEFLQKHCVGWEVFHDWKPIDSIMSERICGVPKAVIEEAAKAFSNAQSACAIGKLGINTSNNGTITYWLVEALNAITGNVDRPGGIIFNPGVLDLNLLSRMSLGKKIRKSKIGGYPYVTGSYPAPVLASEIFSDTPDRIRALMVVAGDPSLSFPNAQNFEAAIERLDLCVSIDMYMNETAQRAHYVLPAANFFEQDDLYITFPDHFPYPFAQWSHKVVEPPEMTRAQWEIFLDLSRHMRIPILNQRTLDLLFRAGNLLGKMTGNPGRFSFDPKNYYKLLLGMMGKIKFYELMKNPHGVKAGDIVFGAALRKLATPSRKIDVAPCDFINEMVRALPILKMSKQMPFILISGERSPHTKNTNLRGLTSLLDKQPENFARINSEDAASLSIHDGDTLEISTDKGTVKIKAMITDKIRKGVISIGHGWGRKPFHPDMPRAGKQEGVNVNLLTDDSRLEPLVGMPIYNSIPCRVRKCAG